MVSDAISPGSLPLLPRPVFDALPQAIAVLDGGGALCAVNRAWHELASSWGDETAGLEALPSRRLAEVATGALPHAEAEYAGHGPAEGRWFLLQAVAIAGGGAVVCHADITAQKRLELRLADLEQTDPLTGILNRRGLERVLATELARMERSDARLSAVLLDLDHLQSINTRLGHGVGDLALHEVARRVRQAVRATDFVGRVGDDELLVLLPETRLGEAYEIAERLRLRVGAEPIATPREPLRLTVSTAVAAVSSPTATIDQLLVAAAAPLAQSKRAGRNRSTRSGEGSARPETLAVLERVSDPDHLRVLRQPILTVADGSIYGYEYSLRGPHGPFEAADDFLRLAAELGHRTSADMACLSAATAAARRAPAPRHFFRIFPATLLEVDLGRLRELLRLTTGPGLGSPVYLELSEQQILGDPAPLRPFLDRLRQGGVRIALDDVGFGRSSLESLVVLEPEVVKLDRRCLEGITHERRHSQIVERLVRAVQALGSEPIAKGVETAAQAEILAPLGIARAQGGFWGPPAPLALAAA